MQKTNLIRCFISTMEQAMENINMLKIKEVLGLKYNAGLSTCKIARALNIVHTVVSRYIQRLEERGISHNTLTKLSDRNILTRLYSSKPKPNRYLLPDWREVHLQLHSKIVTLELLH